MDGACSLFLLPTVNGRQPLFLSCLPIAASSWIPRGIASNHQGSSPLQAWPAPTWAHHERDPQDVGATRATPEKVRCDESLGRGGRGLMAGPELSSRRLAPWGGG